MPQGPDVAFQKSNLPGQGTIIYYLINPGWNACCWASQWQGVCVSLFIYLLIFILCDRKKGKRTTHLPHSGMESGQGQNRAVVSLEIHSQYLNLDFTVAYLQPDKHLNKARRVDYWRLSTGFHDPIVFHNSSSERCAKSLQRNLKQKVKNWYLWSTSQMTAMHNESIIMHHIFDGSIYEFNFNKFVIKFSLSLASLSFCMPFTSSIRSMSNRIYPFTRMCYNWYLCLILFCILSNPG